MNKKQLRNFKKKIRLIPGNACWEWIGSTDRKGYGHFRLNDKIVRAHRVSYNNWYPVCPIDNPNHEHDLDHTCNNKSCVNPCHLKPITNRENTSNGKLLNPNKSSKYVGVSLNKHNNKWQAHIRINNKKINLGTYALETDAAKAYNKALQKLEAS